MLLEFGRMPASRRAEPAIAVERNPKSKIAPRIIRVMNWKIHVHFRVRNESICYIVSIDRAKPDNSVRINPATRHSETKYGFVILTGDMIFKDFFVGVKPLLRHEHLSRANAIC